MPKYNTGSQFDEFFMNAFQFQQKLNQRRDEFKQDINFKLRELTLLSDYYDDIDKRSQRNADIRSDEGLGRLYGQGFTDTQEGQTPDVNVFGQGLTSPVIESKPEGIERTITRNVNGKPIIFGVTDSGEQKELGEKYIKPNKEGKDKAPVKLTTKGVDAFNRLKDPSLYDANETGLQAGGIAGINFNIGGSQKPTLRSDFGIVVGQLLDNSTQKWLDDTIQFMGGYPTTEQLTNAITEKADKGKFTEEQIEQLLNFMDVYSQFQRNLQQSKKIEGFIPEGGSTPILQRIK